MNSYLKTLILLAMVAAPAAATAQSYTIKGKITDVKEPAKVYRVIAWGRRMCGIPRK